MVAAQLTHRRLHLRGGLMRTRHRPVRPILQARQAVGLVATDPGVHLLVGLDRAECGCVNGPPRAAHLACQRRPRAKP